MTTTKPKLPQWLSAVWHKWHQGPKSSCFWECQKISIQPQWPSTWAEQFPKLSPWQLLGDRSGTRPANRSFCMAAQNSVLGWTCFCNGNNKIKTIPETFPGGASLRQYLDTACIFQDALKTHCLRSALLNAPNMSEPGPWNIAVGSTLQPAWMRMLTNITPTSRSYLPQNSSNQLFW